MSEWKPIETAPKDGTVILGWRYYVIAMRWNDDHDFPWDIVNIGPTSNFAFTNQVGDGDHALTHWMPLPDAPDGAK